MALTWESAGSVLVPQIGANGQRVDYWRVNFTVSDGSSGYVEVPDGGDWAAQAKQQIEQKVAQISQLAAGG